MPLKYDPNNVGDCLPEGDYDAVLKKVTDEISKSSGTEMQVWQIDVYDEAGTEHSVKDYVTAGSAFKIKQLALALGQRKAFDAGTFQAENFEGNGIKVKLKIEKSDEYGDKNRIAAYKPSALAGTNPQAPQRSPLSSLKPQVERAGVAPTPPYGSGDKAFNDDDIPF